MTTLKPFALLAANERRPLPAKRAQRAKVNATAEQPSQGRRRVSTLLGLAGIAATTGLVGNWYWKRPVVEQALHSGVAQSLSHSLADGSVLELGPNTDLVYSGHRRGRVVRLTRGEVTLAVRPDELRPFYVETEWGRLRVAGANFKVLSRDGRMQVAVAEGRVSVWARQSPQQFAISLDAPDIDVVHLNPGDSIQADPHGLHQRRPTDLVEWPSKVLVARR